MQLARLEALKYPDLALSYTLAAFSTLSLATLTLLLW